MVKCPRLFATGIAALGIVALCSGISMARTPAEMAADICERYPTGTRHGPQNIILMVLDDTSAAELPGFTSPVEWETPVDPGLLAARELREAGVRRPDLNRLMSRVYAMKDDPTTQGMNECPSTTAGSVCLGPVAPSNTPATDPKVIPVDLDDAGNLNDAADFRYAEDTLALPGDTEPVASRHVLRGFGGLARLARDGVAFPRHYAPSGRCGPTRASILSGRSNREVGVRDNGNQLRVDEWTIAEFLKQTVLEDVTIAGAPPGTKKPVYRTGHIGKWHLGNGGRKTSSERGFDESFVYYGPSRRHNRTTTLKCAAPIDGDPSDDAQSGYLPRPKSQSAFFCEASLAMSGQGCTTDSQCDTAAGAAAGTWACAVGHKDDQTNPFAGTCYPKKPTPCDPASASACGSDPDKCVKWGKYLGPQPATVRYACHPGDVDNPLCCAPRTKKHKEGRDDGYPFSKRRRGGSRYWQWDGGSGADDQQPCYFNTATMRDGSAALLQNDWRAGNTGLAQAGCRYDTRYYRDAAKNFILRNRNQPFFLYMALHGLHAPSMAPRRVEAHYFTGPGRPKAPNDADGFWGALEEIDAAIGQVIGMVEGFCDGDPSSYAGYGEACKVDGDCPAPAVGPRDCNDMLAANTLVLLTSDQGRPSNGFGEIILAGGKSSVEEGGIRVGLQAWSGSTLNVHAPDTANVSSGVSTHADVLATVAHAAGCQPDQEGRYQIRSCANSTRKMCDVDADCKQPNGEACTASEPCPCVTRVLAGRSLLPVLSTTVKNYNEGVAGPIQPRPFAFAEYSGAGKTIVTRTGFGLPGTTPPRVCGRRDTAEAGGVEAAPIDRFRQAGSTTVCTQNTDCQSAVACSNGRCGGVATAAACTTNYDCGTCLGNGKFCVPADSATACRNPVGSTSCEWKEYARCLGTEDCKTSAPESETCMSVHVECDVCPEAAAWKLTGKSGEGAANMDAELLFDLTTNPEEEKALSLKGKPWIAAIESDLLDRLGGWYDCVVAGSASNVDCEAKRQSQ